MFKGFRSIESRLIFWVLAGTSVIFLLTYFFLYRQFLDYTTANIQREARLLTVTLAREIDARMQAVGGVTRQLAAAISTVRPNERELSLMLRQFVEDNGQLYSSAAAFDENRFPGNKRMGISVRPAGDSYDLVDLTASGHEYWTQNWYELTWRSRQSSWHEPAPIQDGKGVITTTYATLIPGNSEDRPWGVLTADISMETSRQRIRSAMEGRKGFAIVVSGSGLILDHPNEALIGRENFGGLISKGINPEYRRIAERIATGKDVVTSVIDQQGETLWVAYSPLKEAQWSLIYVIPEHEFLADVAHLVQMGALWAMLGILLLVALVVYLARRISRPLKQLAIASHEVAEGKLDFKLPEVDKTDEIGALTEAFSRMRDSLHDHIDDLKNTTAEKQKMESELDIAAQIQRGMLKDERFSREEPVHYEIAAYLKPAKAVGGDFYDYMELPDGQLGLVIGDVSDKGVHAALFMARAISSVRNAMSSNGEPDEILKAVNTELCRNNDACMFTTLFIAVQDIRFGYLRFASGGHDPAILLNPLGEARFLDGESGPAVGLDEDAEYEAHKVRLRFGDVFLLYTDGVTESANTDGELYGDDRMLNSVQGLVKANADKALTQIVQGAEDFAFGAPPADDLTLLSLRYGIPRKKDMDEGMKRLWKQSSD